MSIEFPLSGVVYTVLLLMVFLNSLVIYTNSATMINVIPQPAPYDIKMYETRNLTPITFKRQFKPPVVLSPNYKSVQGVTPQAAPYAPKFASTGITKSNKKARTEELDASLLLKKSLTDEITELSIGEKMAFERKSKNYAPIVNALTQMELVGVATAAAPQAMAKAIIQRIDETLATMTPSERLAALPDIVKSAAATIMEDIAAGRIPPTMVPAVISAIRTGAPIMAMTDAELLSKIADANASLGLGYKPTDLPAIAQSVREYRDTSADQLYNILSKYDVGTNKNQQKIIRNAIKAKTPITKKQFISRELNDANLKTALDSGFPVSFRVGRTAVKFIKDGGVYKFDTDKLKKPFDFPTMVAILDSATRGKNINETQFVSYLGPKAQADTIKDWLATINTDNMPATDFNNVRKEMLPKITGSGGKDVFLTCKSKKYDTMYAKGQLTRSQYIAKQRSLLDKE